MAQKKPRNPDQLTLVYGEALVGSDKETLFDVYGHSLSEAARIEYPNALSTDQVIDHIAKFKLDGAQVALVDGSFDVPQPNHEWYLRHCRMLAAQQLLLARGNTITIDSLQETVESDLVRLIVTVDADMKVSRKKGKKLEKGGIDRPVYPWETRADRVAGYTFQARSGVYRPVVDLVTVEGDDQHIGTPLETSLTLAEYLARQKLLDNLIMYGEHPETINQADSAGITPIVIPDNMDYIIDARTGLGWKSSHVIARIQGKTGLGNVATRHTQAGK